MVFFYPWNVCADDYQWFGTVRGYDVSHPVSEITPSLRNLLTSGWPDPGPIDDWVRCNGKLATPPLIVTKLTIEVLADCAGEAECLYLSHIPCQPRLDSSKKWYLSQDN